MERLKKCSYHEIFANCYFFDGPVIETYQNAEFLRVTRGNFLDFVT